MTLHHLLFINMIKLESELVQGWKTKPVHQICSTINGILEYILTACKKLKDKLLLQWMHSSTFEETIQQYIK